MNTSMVVASLACFCIAGGVAAPERAGKQVIYRSHHFAQALVVRKLLWERVNSERLVELMAGRSTDETKRMLFEGIEIVSRQGAGAGKRGVRCLLFRFIGLISGSFARPDQLKFSTTLWLRFPGPLHYSGSTSNLKVFDHTSPSQQAGIWVESR
jgi:hypothetical protein